jgi:dTDP-4-dehydrorhamnose reductase
VSPTYVPDLVNATLDLLIDDEQGVWHLSNEAAVTWYDFACIAAAACGRPTGLIEPAAARDVWSPAVRPRYSALRSGRGYVMRPLAQALSAFAQTRASNPSVEAAPCALR